VEALSELPLEDVAALACGHSLAGVPLVCARMERGGDVYVGTLEAVPGQAKAREPLGASQMDRIHTTDGVPLRATAAAVGQDGTVLVADGDGALWWSQAGQSGAVGGTGGPSSLAELFWRPSTADPITAIACGGGHCLALTRAGELLTWGSGRQGQLGHGDDADAPSPRPIQMGRAGLRFVSIAAGHAHSAATCSRFHLFTWGDGGDGRLGHDASEPRRRTAPTELGAPRACEVAAGITDTQLGLSDSWRAPALGERHSGGLTRDGAVLTCMWPLDS